MVSAAKIKYTCRVLQVAGLCLQPAQAGTHTPLLKGDKKMFDKKTNDSLSFEMLSANQVQSLHLASLDVLENTGIKVADGRALQLLKDAGARVDGDLATIPAALVKAALASAPERTVLYASDRTGSVRLESGVVSYGSGCCAPYIKDLATGENRPTAIGDVENAAKIVQSAKNIDFISCLDVYPGVDPLSDLQRYRAIRSWCKKPVLFRAGSHEGMKAIVELAANFPDAARAVAFSIRSTMPLIYDEETVKQLFLCADTGLPVAFASSVIMGETGPAKLAGSLVLGNASALAGLVLHQLKCKGAPFIYGIELSVRGRGRNLTGGPEAGAVSAVVGRLGQFYGLPTCCCAGISDSFSLDAQAGMESIYSIMLAALGGTNLVCGNGTLGSGAISDLGKIMFDDECMSFTNFLAGGIDFNEDTLALNLIDRIGPGGNFIAEDHTYKYYKKETWYPVFLNRKPFKTWEGEGGKTIADLVYAKALKVLDTSETQLSEAEAAAMNKIISRYEAGA
jgi:trimethylamine--corrinoid protein Co-methyltransferase